MGVLMGALLGRGFLEGKDEEGFWTRPYQKGFERKRHPFWEGFLKGNQKETTFPEGLHPHLAQGFD